MYLMAVFEMNYHQPSDDYIQKQKDESRKMIVPVVFP